jgi:hypothetical protein
VRVKVIENVKEGLVTLAVPGESLQTRLISAAKQAAMKTTTHGYKGR